MFGGGANRPVRQRKSVSHYSDDNPNTFTVKKKKQGPQQQQGDQQQQQQQQQSLTTATTASDPKRRDRHHPKKKKKKKKKNDPKQPPPPPPGSRAAAAGGTTAATVVVADHNPPPRKRGRPPKNRNLPPPPSATGAESESAPAAVAPPPLQRRYSTGSGTSGGGGGSSAVTTASSAAPSTTAAAGGHQSFFPFPKRGKGGSNHPKTRAPPVAAAAANHNSSSSHSSKRRLPSGATAAAAAPRQRRRLLQPVPSPDRPPEDDAVLAHAVTLQPILPLHLYASPSPSNNGGGSGSGANPSNGSRRLPGPGGAPGPKPAWRRLGPLECSDDALSMAASAHSAASASSLGGGGGGARDGMISWFSLRRDGNGDDDCRFAVAGTVRGTVALHDFQRPAAATCRRTLAPSAGRRERTRVVTSRRVIRYPNAVAECAWCRNVVVVRTETELEAVCVGTGARLWRRALAEGCGAGGGGQAPSLSLRQQRRRPPRGDRDNRDDDDGTMRHYQLLWTAGDRQFAEDHLNKNDAAAAAAKNEDNDDGDGAAAAASNDDEQSTPSDEEEEDGDVLWKLDFAVPDYSVDWNRTAAAAEANDDDDDDSWSSTQMIPVQRARLEPTDTERFACWTAVWESQPQQNASSSSDNNNHNNDTTATPTCLAIAQTAPDSVELLRLSCSGGGGATGNASILVRRDLAVKTGAAAAASVQDCCIQQFRQHTFVCAAGRGIRMYLTDNLVWLSTFGETVQLHGKIVQWNRCAWVRAPTNNNSSRGNRKSATTKVCVAATELSRSSTNTLSSKKQPAVWLERSDALQQDDAATTTDSDDDSEGDGEHWLVGVPHPFKGPAELQSTLYVWKPGAATVTLPGPPSGCLGDLAISPDNGWRMIGVAAATGQMHEWSPTMRTDFAGIMYPVGYQVVQDNVEYIEDEDELDQAVVAVEVTEEEDAAASAPASPFKKKAATGFGAAKKNSSNTESEEEAMDPDLAEALRLSMLEHQKKMSEMQEGEEVKLSVLPDSDNDDDDDDDFVIPCWPEIDNEGDPASAPNSPQRVRALSNVADGENAFEHVFLAALPEHHAVRKERQAVAEKRAAILMENAAAAAAEKPKGKGKRTRTANVEALLHASVDPELQRRMDLIRGDWSGGRGSSLPECKLEDDNEEEDTDAEPQEKCTEANRRNDLSVSIPDPPEIPRKANASAAIVRAASAEEKALAMELLLLSPSNSQNGSQEGSAHGSTRAAGNVDATAAPSWPVASETEATASTVSKEVSEAPPKLNLQPSLDPNDVVVTPSDTSPTLASPAAEEANPGAVSTNGNAATVHEDNSESELCAACHGRLVVHSCGKREMPIDYEAIARAEQERKEREAAEKHRIRAEKRRLAEAKRREARRLKKLEEERQRAEEEERRARELEAPQYEPQASFSTSGPWAASQPSQYNATKTQLPRESNSPSSQYQHQRADPFTSGAQYRQYEQPSEEHVNPRPQTQSHNRKFFTESSRRASYASSTHSTHSWNGSVQRTTPSSINVDGTEIQTSASLHPTDALAALAGLADSLSQPVPTNDSQGISQNRDWNSSSTAGSFGQQPKQPSSHHYEYHGSNQRRDIIARAFSTANGQESSFRQSDSVPNTYNGGGIPDDGAMANGPDNDQKPAALTQPQDLAPTYETARSVTEELPTKSVGQATYITHTDYRTNTRPPARQELSQSQPSATAQEIPVQTLATQPVVIAIENSSAQFPSSLQTAASAQPDTGSQAVQIPAQAPAIKTAGQIQNNAVHPSGSGTEVSTFDTQNTEQSMTLQQHPTGLSTSVVRGELSLSQEAHATHLKQQTTTAPQPSNES